ncbi:MAG: LacI family transcriptional regulator [Cytophagales bacterium CG18_big_fil_WC_8_21_14_2_50_42_9]|nr:MAG: LacI family transcriptional regulator [Cytophagales bacterium CG18_big_fil_WC_8_21_14_2_50_42_9]
MKKKLSITDIARQLEISITTVSFILNGKAEEKRISKDVTEKVLNLVAELNYKPNQLAQSLRTGKTHIIGLIVEDIAGSFFANVARLIEENAYKNGYRIIYCSTENKTNKAKELINMFRDRHVDGYIINPSEGIEDDIASLLQEGLPVVLFDRYLPKLPTNYVVIDNYSGTFNAANHLLQQGFSNIAFLTIDSEQTQMEERYNGYERAMKMHNKQKFVKQIGYYDERESVVQQITDFIKENPAVDAIIFATNYLSIYGLEALKQLKLNIPNDIGVVSFDDHEFFKLYSPTITAIAQPVEEISRQVIKILISNLTFSGDKWIEQTVVLPSDLIIRESSIKSPDA